MMIAASKMAAGIANHACQHGTVSQVTMPIIRTADGDAVHTGLRKNVLSFLRHNTSGEASQ